MAQIDAFAFKILTPENKVSNHYINKLSNEDLLNLLLDSSVEIEVKNAIIQFILDIKLDEEKQPDSRGVSEFADGQSIVNVVDALHANSEPLLRLIIDETVAYEKRVIAAQEIKKRIIPSVGVSNTVEVQDLELLNKFNWGAFFLTGLWAIAYSQWSWLGLFVILNFIGKAVGAVDETGMASLLYGAFLLFISYLFGKKANQLAWEKRAGEFKTVENLLKAQTKWVYWGLPINLAIYAIIIISIFEK